MVFLQKLISSVIYVLVLLSGVAIAQDNLPTGFDRDALLALRDGFKHPFLEKNWTGLQCNLNASHSWYGIQCSNGRVVGIVLEGLGLTGSVDTHTLVPLTELSSLSFKNNSISGDLMDFSFNTKLMHLNLSDNMFDGLISDSLLSLDNLHSLQLQGNNLTGRIPGFSKFSLTEFNVSNNNLLGEIPRTKVLQSFTFSSYFGNPGLCGPPSPFVCDNISGKDSAAGKHLDSSSKVAIFVVLDVIVLAVAVFLFILYKKTKKKKEEKKGKENEEEKNKNEEKIENGENRPAAKEAKRHLIFMDETIRFELNDLFKASAEGLGKGNFANTYKATMDRGEEVVVKRLRDLKPLNKEEFTKQMRVLADLKHPNLLSLLAYHYSLDEKLMVYKFARNGSLFNRLHVGKGKNRIPFRWNSRLLVAQGVARAMEFLHRNMVSQTTVPHGNLKSSNVLLDENEMAIVSDYGLASLIAFPIAAQHMTSYKTPDYQNRKQITKKADLMTFGSLLLELLTGRISIYSAPKGANGLDLCTWVHRAVREEWTAEIFDLEISSQRNTGNGMLQLLQIALRCCDKLPEKRPDMEEVVRAINGIKVCDSEDDSDFSFEPSQDSLSTNP